MRVEKDSTHKNSSNEHIKQEWKFVANTPAILEAARRCDGKHQHTARTAIKQHLRHAIEILESLGMEPHDEFTVQDSKAEHGNPWSNERST